MPASSPGDRVLRFGLCTANLTERWITRGAVVQKLNPKDWLALDLLLSKRGELVSYEEFKETLWPDVMVEVHPGMHTRVSAINRALGGSGYIENVKDEGYIFRASVPVDEIIVPFPSSAILETPLLQVPVPGSDLPARPPRRRWMQGVILFVLLGITVTVMIVAVRRNSQSAGKPARVSLKGRMLEMLDQESNPIWRVTLPGNPNPLPLPENFTYARPVITDLDGDGKKELLYNFLDIDRPEAQSTLFCFDSLGKVRWKRLIGREIRTLGNPPRIYPQNYTLTWIATLHRPYAFWRARRHRCPPRRYFDVCSRSTYQRW